MTETHAAGQRAALHGVGSRRHIPRELLVSLLLAVLGTAAFPFGPPSLPMHWGLGDSFDSFASRWVVLLAVPWSCVVLEAVLTSLPRYTERRAARLSAQVLPVVPLALLLVALVYVAVGSPPLSGPE